MNKILLVDVSNLFFRAFYAVPSHFTMSDGTPSNAIYGTISVLFSLLETERPQALFAARDLKGPTFRHEEIEGYKKGRPEMPPELSQQLPLVFDFFSEALNIPLLSKETFEADDIIATVAEHYRGKEDTEVLILSADQDLFQIIGENVYCLIPQNGGKPAKKMDSAAVIEKLGVPPLLVPDYKGIAGDSSDRLTGVPGIGPKGAVKILDAFSSLENAIEHVGEIPGKNGLLLKEHAEHALHTKRMATLHRDLDIEGFDAENGKLGEKMPENLIPFLEKVSSRRLQSRAEKIFTPTVEKEPEAEQLGLF